MELFQTCGSTIILIVFFLRVGREYIHYIAEAVKEKVVAIIVSKNFMAILSDGSQARKNQQ